MEGRKEVHEQPKPDSSEGTREARGRDGGTAHEQHKLDNSPPRTHTHTHTHTYICVCVCVCIYMCVCVCTMYISGQRDPRLPLPWSGPRPGSSSPARPAPRWRPRRRAGGPVSVRVCVCVCVCVCVSVCVCVCLIPGWVSEQGPLPPLPFLPTCSCPPAKAAEPPAPCCCASCPMRRAHIRRATCRHSSSPRVTARQARERRALRTCLV